MTNGALAEGINGVRAVQSMDRARVNFVLYDDKARMNLAAHLRAARYAQVMVPIVDTLTGLAMAVVIVVGGARVIGNHLDVGVMVAFLFYIQRFFDPIRSLTMQYSVMQRAMASGHRITEVLDVMTSLAKDGMTMMVVTHEMGFARKAANRVVFMADGAIVEETDPESFFTNPSSERAKDFLAKILTH